MSITRKTMADEIDRADDEIAELQKEKAIMFGAYREQLEGAGFDKPTVKAEVAALKAAIRRRRDMADDPQAVAKKDALFEEILIEICERKKSGTSIATRARAPRASEPAADQHSPHRPSSGEEANATNGADDPRRPDSNGQMLPDHPSPGGADQLDIPKDFIRDPKDNKAPFQRKDGEARAG